MTYLLDTHVLIWWATDDRRLSSHARRLIAAPENRLLVSSASAWEVSTKQRLGKLILPEAVATDLAGWISGAGFEELPVSIRHAQKAGEWKPAHRDPFDRMLAAQSALEHVPLISADKALRDFGIELVW